jgi:SAM-dependent methyltransferase
MNGQVTTMVDELPGLAGAIRRALGPSLRQEDLYSDRGSRLYHELTATDPAEIREITRLLRGVRGPVLELACGSGRLTLPLAAAGHDVTGVDLSPRLLATLAERLASPEGARLRGQVRLVEADIVDLPLTGRFATVVLGATTIRLFGADHRRRLFARVHDLLLPGGSFLVSTAGSSAPSAQQSTGRFAGTEDQPDLRPNSGLHRRTDGHDIVTTMALRDCVVTLIQHVAGDGSRRGIAALQVTPGGPPSLFTSSVHHVPPQLAQAELEAAGFRIEQAVEVSLPRELGLGDDVLLVATVES